LEYNNYHFYNSYINLIDIQKGGCKVKKYKIQFLDHTFIVYYYDEGDRITYSVHNNNDFENPNQCILLFSTILAIR